MVKRTTTDAAFSEAVREMYNWTCQNCGIIDTAAQMGQRPSIMDCSHILTRKYKGTRTYPDNALCICRSCHRKLGDNPLQHASLARKILGEARYDELLHRNNLTFKYTKKDMPEITKHYREELKRLRKLRMEGFTGHIDLVSFD